MQIVIDIPESTYKYLADLVDAGGEPLGYFERVIMRGTPLQKGHGRLIDADKTLAIAWKNVYKHEDEWEKKDENYLPIHRFYDQNGFECCQQTIVNAPTIIETDKENKNADSN